MSHLLQARWHRRVHTCPRRVRALGAVILVAALLPALPLAASASAGPRGSQIPMSPMAGARAQAEATDTPVVVADETTETSEVTAQPDGTFMLTSSLTPVRVQQNGQWNDIDTTLTRTTAGFHPTASVADVMFSAGGSGPAVTLKNGPATVEFSLPFALPSPTVQNDTATYSSVLPGVDLVLTALPASYSEVLVVHDAASANNHALTSMKMSVRADGLTLGEDADGDLIATDDTGAAVFHGSSPIMWDSSHASLTETPSASDPSTGQVNPVSLTVPATDALDGPKTASLTLAPDTGELTDPTTKYPVFIDPALAPSRTHFAVVTTNGNWHYYDDTSNDLKVGYCNWAECNGSWKARTYLSFNTDALTDGGTTAKVYSAEVDAYEIHSAHACTAEPVDLYTAGTISSSTDWPGPIGSKLDSTSSALGNNCNDSAGDVKFNGADVTARFQYAADHDVDTLNFGMRAPDEGEKYQWKRFSAAGGSSGAAAQIVVKYDFPPSTPSGLDIDSTVQCAGNPVYTRDTTPTLHAKATDYNTPHLPVALHFNVATSAGTSVRSNPSGVTVASGAVASWATNSSNSNSTAALGNGAYKFDAYATSASPDTTDTAGTTSGWSSFTIDNTAPPIPTISSFDYPTSTWGTNGAGKFSFAGSSDTAGFAYSFDSSGTEPLPADTTCSYTTAVGTTGRLTATTTGTTASATLTVPALSPGYHTLYVKGFDDAHNVSSQTGAYIFYEAPSISGEGATSFQTETMAQSVSGAGCADGNCVSYSEGPNTRWAGQKELHLVANTGDTSHPAVFTSTFSTGVEADDALNVQVTTQNHFGILTFMVDDHVLQSPSGDTTFDTYSSTLGSKNIALAGLHLIPGSHRFSIEIVGANTASVNYVYAGQYGDPATTVNVSDNGRSAGIDYLRVIPINGAVYGSLNSAMNNDGISRDAAAAGDIGPTLSLRSLSQETLTSAGFGPGASVTVDAGTSDQTTFSMPAANANGTDNVVIMGQTIPLQTPAAASWVDLLMTSTCGSADFDASHEVSVNFEDSSFSQSPLPLVPDWLSGSIKDNGQDAHITLVKTFDYSRAGTVSQTTLKPSLYHVAIPTQNGSLKVTSITLPTIGNDLTQTCASPNVHLFAISTH